MPRDPEIGAAPAPDDLPRPVRCAVLLNAGAGSAGGEAAERVAQALEEAGAHAVVLPLDGPETVRRAAASPRVDAVVAAGGDGTVSLVAAALAGTGKPLGVLPLGTLNHFARDLGVPSSLAEAARVIARGRVRRVDVGEVNGRVFVNNSSVGLYPHAVRERERRRRWLGRWLAMAWAALRLLAKLPRWRLRVSWEGGALERRTPLLFVGNNRYEGGPPVPTGRAGLDEGTLTVAVLRPKSRRALVRSMLHALARGLRQAPDLDVLRARRVLVRSRRSRLHVAVDGEVVRLAPPLRYRVLPGALRVLAPA